MYRIFLAQILVFWAISSRSMERYRLDEVFMECANLCEACVFLSQKEDASAELKKSTMIFFSAVSWLRLERGQIGRKSYAKNQTTIYVCFACAAECKKYPMLKLCADCHVACDELIALYQNL